MSMVDVTDTERRIAERIDPNAATRFEVSTSVGGLGFSNMSQALEFAKMMAISSVAVPKHLRGNPGACLAVVIQAIEWKLSPYAVANKSYSVNDRLAYESQLIQAVILQRAPIDGRFKVEYKGDGDNRVCRVWAKLRGSDETVDYESPKFSKITPKNSPLWKSDPDQQQFYYSGRALCRRHFPDVLLGVYADDEVVHSIGPDTARDVTPTKSLSDKLDVLAQSGTETTNENEHDATSAPSGGEATADPARSAEASPAADQASTQQTSAPPVPAAAANAAAPDSNAQEAPPADPVQSGAVAPSEWPADKVPTSAAEYVEYANAWIAQIGVGQFTPDGARTRWKGELKLRNSCGIDEETRDPIKAALDVACEAAKRAA